MSATLSFTQIENLFISTMGRLHTSRTGGFWFPMTKEVLLSYELKHWWSFLLRMFRFCFKIAVHANYAIVETAEISVTLPDLKNPSILFACLFVLQPSKGRFHCFPSRLARCKETKISCGTRNSSNDQTVACRTFSNFSNIMAGVTNALVWTTTILSAEFELISDTPIICSRKVVDRGFLMSNTFYKSIWYKKVVVQIYYKF